MRSIVASVAIVAVVLLAFVSLAVGQPAQLKVGDKAPDFKLKASDDKEYTLSQFAGKQAVAICWYPHVGSGGTKAQFASLEAVMPQVPRDKVQVFGCGTAALDATKAAAQQGKYSFPLLSDADQSTAKAYGCLQDSGVSWRWTYLIDDQGVVLAIVKNTTPATEGAELLKALVAAKLLPADTVIPAGQAGTAPLAGAGQRVVLKAGDKCPDFKVTGSDGKEYSLDQFAGKSYVALCWTRRAGSGGWKAACDSLQAQWDKLSQYKVKVFMIASSTLKVTQDAMAGGDYSFPMLADADQSVANAFGTLMPGGGNLCERWTFLIDDQGTIVGIDKQIDGANQGQQLLKLLQDNNVGQ